MISGVYKQKTGTFPPVIVVDDRGDIRYLMSDTTSGLKVSVFSKALFLNHFVLTEDDPGDIAKIFREHSKSLGATEEALSYLDHFIPLDEGTLSMARAATAAATTETAPKPKRAATPKVAAAVTEAPKTKKAAANDSAPKERRRSVSSVFCDLIMEGKLTDDQIFEQVAKEFGLDDSKRSYVAWNRNHLKKSGQNPPGPIGVEPKAPRATKPPKETVAPPAAEAPKGKGKGVKPNLVVVPDSKVRTRNKG